MKMTTYTLQGKTYYLCLNAAALFTIYDRFPEAKGVLEPLSASGKRGFEATCAFLAILSTHGELVRRFEGYDKGEVLTEGQLLVSLSPMDMVEARAAIQRAVALGFGREVEDEDNQHEDGAVDLGLQELNAKKAPPASHGRNIWKLLRSFLG